MVEEKVFEGEDYTTSLLPKNEYELCVFKDCNFANSDISNITFTECEFVNCDLSLTNIKHSVFSEVRFIGCKLLGLHFSDCDTLLMSMQFENCNLELAVFYDLNLKRTLYKDCKLTKADFSYANLNQSTFNNCDFKEAIFERTILTEGDLRTSYNFNIDPETNNIKKARFSKDNLAGLLLKHQIKIDG